MDIYVCSLVPSVYGDSMQAKICELNVKISEWYALNNISSINPNLAFRFESGDVDVVCYEIPGQYQVALLNRLGATRLFSTIGKQCDKLRACVNWDKIKCSDFTKISDRRHTTLPPHRLPTHHNQNRDGWQVVDNRRRKSGYGLSNHSTESGNTGHKQ